MVNHWWEIQILCEPLLEDVIFWRLEGFGCKGTCSEQQGASLLVRAYLPEDQAQLLDLAALSLWLRQDAIAIGQSIPAVQWNLIDEEDWSSSWKQYWHPTEVGDRFLIYPAWLPLPESTDRKVLLLDPGAAFGTGTHATTQLCLESLEMRLSVPEAMGITLADIGCGSGILSIGGLLLGASRVYAVDNDSVAVRSTMSNRQLNQIPSENLEVHLGSIDQLMEIIDTPVDGIMCNILAEVIIDLIPKFQAITKPSTWGIISGVLLDQAKPVADTLEEHGWVVATLWRRQEWCCFNIRRT